MTLTKPHVINDFIALEQFSVMCPEFFGFFPSQQHGTTGSFSREVQTQM